MNTKLREKWFFENRKKINKLTINTYKYIYIFVVFCLFYKKSHIVQVRKSKPTLLPNPRLILRLYCTQWSTWYLFSDVFHATVLKPIQYIFHRFIRNDTKLLQAMYRHLTYKSNLFKHTLYWKQKKRIHKGSSCFSEELTTRYNMLDFVLSNHWKKKYTKKRKTKPNNPLLLYYYIPQPKVYV